MRQSPAVGAIASGIHADVPAGRHCHRLLL